MRKKIEKETLLKIKVKTKKTLKIGFCLPWRNKDEMSSLYQVFELSPLENAIETMQNINRDLRNILQVDIEKYVSI